MTTPGKPALGFTILRVPAIQSPNFVAGVSGWQIAKDGSAQFNSIVIPPSSAGNTVFTQGTPPVAFRAGDLWVNTASGNAISVWSGSAWTPYQFGTSAIASGSITAALIAANTITAGQLAAGIIYAGIVNGTTINAGTFTGSVFQGTNFIINAVGAFFYLGVPAAGNLAATIVPGGASVTDPTGFNTAKPGVTVYDTAGTTYVQLLASNPAVVNIGTGDAAEATPGLIRATVNTIGATKVLNTTLRAPRVAGEAAGALSTLILGSPSADLTTQAAQAALTASDGVNTGQFSINPTSAGVNVPLNAIAGTATNATIITTDTWHTLAPVVTGYTVNQCRYRLQPDGTMLFDLQLTAGAGGGTAGTYVLTTTLPVQYQPIGSLARSYPVGYNATLVAGAFFGWLNFDEASSGNAGRVRLQIPGLAATSMIGTTAVVPLN